MIVVADEIRLREGFGEQDGAGAVAATDVRCFSASLKFLLNAVKRRDPGRKKMGIVARAEKPFSAAEEARVMFSPFHTFPSSEILQRALAHVEQILHQQGRTWQINGARGVCEAKLLLPAKRVFAGSLVESDVTTGGLTVQPLADIAFVGMSVAGEFGG